MPAQCFLDCDIFTKRYYGSTEKTHLTIRFYLFIVFFYFIVGCWLFISFSVTTSTPHTYSWHYTPCRMVSAALCQTLKLVDPLPQSRSSSSFVRLVFLSFFFLLFQHHASILKEQQKQLRLFLERAAFYCKLCAQSALIFSIFVFWTRRASLSSK